MRVRLILIVSGKMSFVCRYCMLSTSCAAIPSTKSYLCLCVRLFLYNFFWFLEHVTGEYSSGSCRNMESGREMQWRNRLNSIWHFPEGSECYGTQIFLSCDARIRTGIRIPPATAGEDVSKGTAQEAREATGKPLISPIYVGSQHGTAVDSR